MTALGMAAVAARTALGATGLSAAMPSGVVLPEAVLVSDTFKVLATFVALNTLMYAALALLKLVPRERLRAPSRGRNRRRQNRSIYPDPPGAGG